MFVDDASTVILSLNDVSLYTLKTQSLRKVHQRGSMQVMYVKTNGLFVMSVQEYVSNAHQRRIDRKRFTSKSHNLWVISDKRPSLKVMSIKYAGCQAVILFPTFSYYFLLFLLFPTFSSGSYFFLFFYQIFLLFLLFHFQWRIFFFKEFI